VAEAERAHDLALEAHGLGLTAGDLRCQALALTLCGATLVFRSRYRDALEVYGKARDAAARAGDGVIESRAVNGLGLANQSLGDYGAAMEYFLEGLRIAQSIGDELGRVRVLGNIGVVRTELGEYDLALEAHLEVRAVSERLGHSIAYSTGTINTVVASYHLGRYDEALELGEAHLPLVRKLGVRQHEVVLRAYLTHCLVEAGRAAEAVAPAALALPLAQDVGDYEHLANLRVGYARALHGTGRSEEAEQQLKLALADTRGHGVQPQERNVLRHLADVCAAREDWRAAYEYAAAYHALERTLHAQDVDRRTKVLSAQLQVEILKREAEVERLRNVELARANSDLRAAQETLAYRATHDALTGLANRAHFQAEVERHLAHADGAHVAVLFMDLDGFKQINDTLGHDAGDELLREVAARLKGCVRAGDLVARLGGDEFTVLLPALRSAGDAERVARKMLGVVTCPFDLRGRVLTVTGSIGVAVAPHDGRDVVTLQKHADVAMYHAKRDGKNAVRTYRSDESVRPA